MQAHTKLFLPQKVKVALDAAELECYTSQNIFVKNVIHGTITSMRKIEDT